MSAPPFTPTCSTPGCAAPGRYSALLRGLACAAHGAAPLRRRGRGMIAVGVALLVLGAWSARATWLEGHAGALGWLVTGPMLLGLGRAHLLDARRLEG